MDPHGPPAGKCKFAEACRLMFGIDVRGHEALVFRFEVSPEPGPGACYRLERNSWWAFGAPEPLNLNPKPRVRIWSPYLEGHGDLVNGLITPISHIITPIIPIINLLTESP